MFALLHRFIDICLLRKGPQDLPASGVLLRLAMLLYVLSGLLVFMLDRPLDDLHVSILLIAADIVILSTAVYLILHVRGLLPRLRQTLTALFGTGTLLQLLVLPLMLWLENSNLGMDGAGIILPWLCLQLLLIWSLLIMSFILQQAFAVSRGASLLYALAYMGISIALGSLLPATV